MKKLVYIFSIVVLAFASLLGAQQAHAAPPNNFQTTQIIGAGLDGPSAFEFSPDGRIFILQRTGEIKIYKNNQLLASNFATLPSIASGDRGLIGIAFDPDFTTNHYAYFYYTGLDKLNHLVRFDASSDTGTNQTEIYHTNSPSEQLHVGGTLRFGPDGKLYFAVGDNGYGPNAQDLSNPHGKMMRINKDGTIPTDNPFYGQSGKLGEIWAFGLRNPWRFQFDSATGNLYDGDVGADSWEEINLIVKGGNYGWPNCEGKCVPSNIQYIDPLYTYPHNINGVYQSSAVTQGPMYHGAMFPQEYQGSLFYGDYSRMTIRRLTFDFMGKLSGDYDFDMQAGSVVDMKIAADGSMYYITYYPGRMYRVSYSTTNHVPVANASADNLKGTKPFTVHFSSNGTSDPDNDPLTYSWNFGDGTTSTQANPTKVYSNDGTYTVELTVSDGVNTAQARPIVIQVGCPSIVTIGTPANNGTYKSGDVITVNASAIDCAGFDINDASLSTTVKFHHATHIHPFLDNLPGRSNSFTVPTTGEPSADTWFEIDVTATDTNGLSTTAITNIYPVKSNLTFNTIPAGLQILLDGQPTNTPTTIQGVVGYVREINASNAQQLNGACYDFDHWSDNGVQKHTITTQTTDQTYTAYFKQIPCQNDPALTYAIYDNALSAEWVDWSWNSTNTFNSPNAYSGASAIAWTATKGWAGFFVHRNEIPFDTTGYSAVTFALKATGAGQKIQIQLYDALDKTIGTPVDIAAYGGDPIAGTYKVYSIPLSALGGMNKQINDIHLQNATDIAQPVMYIDRFGFTNTGATSTPTLTPTPTPIQSGPTPIAGSSANLITNNSFEAATLAPWKFDVWGNAAGIITQDTTNKTDGTKSAKVGITRANSTAPYQAQLYQSGIKLTAGKLYTLSFAAKATITRNIDIVLQQLNAPYTVYGQQTAALTTAWKTFTYTINSTGSDTNAFLGFNLASKAGTVWIDAVSLCEGTCSTGTQPTPTPTPTSTPTPTPTVGPTTTPTPTPPVTSEIYYVYDEQLATGWGDWTWSSTINFNDTTKPYKGVKNIDWRPTAQWAGFLPYNQAGFDTTGYNALTFAIAATKPNQKVSVQLYTFNDVPLGTNTDIAKYNGDPTVGTYKLYTIPLSDLAGVNQKLLKFHIQDNSGNTQNQIYLDAVGFVKGSNPTTTPTPTPPQSSGFKIFDDALATGWANWSWGSTINFGATPGFSGTKSISFTATSAWAGLDMHANTGINTSTYTKLHFVLKGTNANQQYGIFMDTQNNNHLSNPLPLTNYGGNPTNTDWKVYEIPLSDLNATNKTIYDVVIHETSGGPQPALYVDEVELR